MNRFVRFVKAGSLHYGLLERRRVFTLQGSIYSDWSKTGKSFALQDVQLLVPCEPSKIICLGLNYRSVAAKKDKPLPGEPILFMKPSSTVVGPGSNIVFPRMSRKLGYEVELAIVVKDEFKRVGVEDARAHILGYTLANDVTAKDLMPEGEPWTKGKCFDTFLPLGPAIATDLDGDNLTLEMYLNGHQVQKSNTSDMIFNVAQIVSYVSQIMTLYPGDVICTGTPLGSGSLEVGDRVEARNEYIGNLSNLVVAE